MTSHNVPVRSNLRLLVAEDELDLRDSLADALRAAGHEVELANDGAEAVAMAGAKHYDALISDINMPKMGGLQVLERMKATAPNTPIILMTAFGGISQAVAALKEGAFDYLTKPLDVDELLVRLERLTAQTALKHELEKARSVLAGLQTQTPMIGNSPGIRRVLEMLTTVAPSAAPVLVTGESGTGKELVAKMLHERSDRRSGPFITVNCGALAENLIEAELFGHERGAFTGADRKRDGRFKAADGGTLFLDEIGELPLPSQAKLLRVLQEGTFEPLGSNTSVTVDVRIVSATHRKLRARVEQGLFREDLYYRINVIELALPPLRERRGDFPALVQHFLSRFAPKGSSPRLSPEAWTLLEQHEFRGNIRELSHALQHAVILSGGEEILPAHLPTTITGPTPMKRPTEAPAAATGSPPPMPAPTEAKPLSVAMKEYEREYLMRTLARTKGRRSEAAALLGISRKTLWEKLKSYGVDEEAEAASIAAASGAPPRPMFS
ncbi:MAG TPA: sigma-54 dependent transcriptional regulator [Polyangia bacterium]